jgi:hypothetical protein
MWYGVKVLIRSHIVETSEDGLWEEGTYLIEADSPMEAERKAVEVASQENCEYKAEAGTIRWEVDSFMDAFELFGNKVGSGSQVYSRIVSKEDAEKLKAMFSKQE